MHVQEILLGMAFIGAASLAWWIALPRDGEVREFLRNDQVQAYYAVAILGSYGIGLANIITGLWP
jgi:hypothetical protein